jgi:hypothetical protein
MELIVASFLASVLTIFGYLAMVITEHLQRPRRALRGRGLGRLA